MEHPGGSDHPLLGTLFGHRGRSEAVRAGRPLASLRELGELLAAIKEPRWPSSLRRALSSWPELAQLAHVAPRRTPRAMFSDALLEGDDIDRSRLPNQRCWPGDVGRLVALGLVVPRGTRKQRPTISLYQMHEAGRDGVKQGSGV